MPDPARPEPIPQGAGEERLPLPPMSALDPAQHAAAQALIDGPRKAVYGPFVPLLRTPALLDKVAQLGETLRFGGALAADVRELATCLAAQHVGNQFEWVMHVPLARAAGVPQAALQAVHRGERLSGLAPALQASADFCAELLATHEVGDETYAAARAQFGEAGVVELGTLVGYFVMVSWVMNIARTPSRPTAEVTALPRAR
ncbi:MAG: carboxymuconolactone decarboxylase family protein [Burkholderiales bacterium]|nr:carboxymuconolactone decarboxylase family protein [Burkholderiales bacterium]